MDTAFAPLLGRVAWRTAWHVNEGTISLLFDIEHVVARAILGLVILVLVDALSVVRLFDIEVNVRKTRSVDRLFGIETVVAGAREVR